MTRRVRIALALVLIAGCSDRRGGGSGGPRIDAGEPFDWTTVALPSPIVGCGDELVDPGESCDDGNSDSTDACVDCRYATLCGNSLLESGEECDDGNRLNGDGCRASCASETCGDGRVDSPAEACDDSSSSCTSCTVPATCGDGVRDLDEGCDDGNSADWDGCSASCVTEQAFVVADLGFAIDPSSGCDVTGTGLHQNAIGRAFTTTAAAWNYYIASQLRDIVRRSAIAFSGFPRGEPSPGRFRVAFFDAVVEDPVTRTITRTGLGFDYSHASLDGATVVTERADIHLQAGGAVVIDEPLARAQFRVTGSPDMLAPVRVEGILCGVVLARSLASAEDTIGTGATAEPVFCAPIGRILSITDLVAGGRALGFLATQPDVDLDGDGLEQLVVAGTPDDSCIPVVVGCIEGDGTATDDPACVFDFDDGWSVSFFLGADRAQLVAP